MNAAAKLSNTDTDLIASSLADTTRELVSDSKLFEFSAAGAQEVRGRTDMLKAITDRALQMSSKYSGLIARVQNAPVIEGHFLDGDHEFGNAFREGGVILEKLQPLLVESERSKIAKMQDDAAVSKVNILLAAKVVDGVDSALTELLRSVHQLHAAVVNYDAGAMPCAEMEHDGSGQISEEFAETLDFL